MESLDISVPGATLRALRFGNGPNIIVAAHGITASATAFRTIGRELPDTHSLVAVDLRGRGASANEPGPYGMDTHGSDLAAVAEHFGAPVIITGHSMGAYAALRAAATRPELFSRLVLIDGGLPLPIPPGIEPDALVAATVGPAVERLAQTFASTDEYIDFFRRHPALADDWTDDLTEYVRYDARAGEDGTVRSKVNSDAVFADGRDLVVGVAAVDRDLRSLESPPTLYYASRGMLGQEPGFLPRPLVDLWAENGAIVPRLVDDANHYTILTKAAAAALIAADLAS